METNRTTNKDSSRKTYSGHDGKTSMNKDKKADGKADRTTRSI